MLSISILFNTVGLLPEIGKPSTTYNGSLLPWIELVPRIRTLIAAPGAPVFCNTCTPGALPDNACKTFVAGNALRSLDFTCATAPVRSRFLTVPYPITTTSLISLKSSTSFMLIVTVFPTIFSSVTSPTYENTSTAFVEGTVIE